MQQSSSFVRAVTHFYRRRFLLLVPDDGGELLRRFVEALLITHAETKLNAAGHLTRYDRNYQRIVSRNPLAHGLWLDGLIRPTRHRDGQPS